MYSILIIEDDPLFSNMTKTILEMEGFETRTASNGLAGLALIRESRPDLILCDIMMPGMDGYSVLDSLKGDSALGDIPFIFVTALGNRDQVRGGMSAGADDYLSKPFTSHELLAAVTGRINRHERINNRNHNQVLQEELEVLRTTVTNREREVLHLVGSGATSKEISKQLGVCQKTVEAHRTKLMKKLHTTNAAGLARWAVIANLAPNGSKTS